MNIGDTAAAKNVSRLFGLTEWPEHDFKNFPLHTGSVLIWLDYVPENQSLRLEATVNEIPVDLNPAWLGVILAGSAPNDDQADAWLGLVDGHITIQAVRFPGQGDVDDLDGQLAAFVASVQAWRDLLSADHLKVPPAEVLGAAD